MGFLDGLEKTTGATLFLLKGVGLNKEELASFGFINAFIDDKDHEPHYKKAVYVLFQPKDMDEFRFFLMTEQDKHSMILEDYDYEGGYVVIVYGFPVEFYKEYDNFLEGNFSMFRKSYTKLFPMEAVIKRELGSTRTKSLYYHVFNRTSYLKSFWENKIGQEIEEEAEYWSKPDIEKETLDIEKIKAEHNYESQDHV